MPVVRRFITLHRGTHILSTTNTLSNQQVPPQAYGRYFTAGVLAYTHSKFALYQLIASRTYEPIYFNKYHTIQYLDIIQKRSWCHQTSSLPLPPSKPGPQPRSPQHEPNSQLSKNVLHAVSTQKPVIPAPKAPRPSRQHRTVGEPGCTRNQSLQ
jgi:hypothetical protein